MSYKTFGMDSKPGFTNTTSFDGLPYRSLGRSSTVGLFPAFRFTVVISRWELFLLSLDQRGLRFGWIFYVIGEYSDVRQILLTVPQMRPSLTNRVLPRGPSSLGLVTEAMANSCSERLIPFHPVAADRLLPR